MHKIHLSASHIVFLLSLVSACPQLYGIPQFALLTGNRCSNCHVNKQGGGLRTELGWYAYSDVGLISRNNTLGNLVMGEGEANSMFDGAITIGMDFRLQFTRSFYNANASPVVFPMQTQPYVSYPITHWLTAEGSLNLAHLWVEYPTWGKDTILYPGTRAGHASFIIQPMDNGPELRVGYFRPSIGMRFDDHTMFTQSIITPTSRRPLFAPNYVEYGAEITYEGLDWLTLQAGFFDGRTLSQIMVSADRITNVPIVADNSVSFTGRAVLWIPTEYAFSNGFLGASVLANDQTLIANAFAGFGITDYAALWVDYTRVSVTGISRINNISAELMYQAHDSFLPFIRVEQAQTTHRAIKQTSSVNSLIIGAKIFLVPFVALRPEYRILDTELPGYTSRWNFQVHVFY